MERNSQWKTSRHWLRKSGSVVEIQQAADSVLSDYWDPNKIPVDPEIIADVGMEINIVTIPGLKRLHGIEGAISFDLQHMYLDDSAQGFRERFTISHEIGHRKLHGDFLNEYKINSLQSILDFQQDISDKDRDKMEWQANVFASFLLVPTVHLKHFFQNLLSGLDDLTRRAKESGIPRESYLPNAISNIARPLAKQFEVTEQVMVRAIERDSLQRLID